jgi:4-amino-4-deoxy-L-arabinose transferase-like glycosyltransferase
MVGLMIGRIHRHDREASVLAKDPTQPQTRATAAASVGEGPRRVELPETGQDKLGRWGLLLLTVLLCAAPLLVEVGQPDVSGPLEHVVMVSSQETWLNVTGNEHLLTGAEPAAEPVAPTLADWLVPTWNGRPRINKPPLLVWEHVGAWYTLDPQQTSPQALVLIARLVAVVMALVGLAATFWAGHSAGGLRTAALATLVTGTFFIFIDHARQATYDVHLFGWVTLAVAAGLWAMRPRKPLNWVGRRVVGWLLCGVAIGAGLMTKNPLAMGLAVVPLIAAIIVTPYRRLGNVIGLLFAMLLGAFAAAPWYLYVAEQFPDAFGVWNQEYGAARAQGNPPWYYLGLIALVFPWTIWLVGALFQPWLTARGPRRRMLLIAWLWLVCTVVLLSIPGAKQMRYLLPVLPGAGLLIAQLWSWHSELAGQRRTDPGVNLLRLPHWIMLLGASLAVPLFWAYQSQATSLANDLLGQRLGFELAPPELGSLPPWLVITWAGALLVTAILGTRWHFKWQPTHAATCTAIWALLLMSVAMFSYAHSPHSVYPHRADARQVRQTITGSRFMFYYDPLVLPEAARNPGYVEPDEEFLFYVQRIVNHVTADQLADLADQPVFLMVRPDPEDRAAQMLGAHGYVHVMDFSDGRNVPGLGGATCHLYASPAVAVLTP